VRFKQSNNSRRFVVAMVAVLVAISAASAMAQGNGPGTKVIATLFSTLGPAGWEGNAILLVGDEAMTATYTCAGPLPTAKPGGALNGTETCTFTVVGEGTFQLNNEFMALPDSAPGLYTMHTISAIANGTGRFAGTSGKLIERAQFVFPFALPVTPALGRSEGTIFGFK
jgi:hypothetical protein